MTFRIFARFPLKFPFIVKRECCTYGHENEASNGVNVDLLGKLLI